MKVLRTKFPEVKLIEINEYPDEREMQTNCVVTYQWNVMRQYVNKNARPFLSETETYVKRADTLRGLYYDLPPRAGDTLVRCIKGHVFLAVVDLRENSPNYRKWMARGLSAENRLQMYIPAGFAYGFLTLCDDVVLQHKSTSYVGNNFKKVINYADPLIGIAWPRKPIFMSAQVKFAPGIEQVELEKVMDWIDESEDIDYEGDEEVLEMIDDEGERNGAEEVVEADGDAACEEAEAWA